MQSTWTSGLNGTTRSFTTGTWRARRSMSSRSTRRFLMSHSCRSWEIRNSTQRPNTPPVASIASSGFRTSGVSVSRALSPNSREDVSPSVVVIPITRTSHPQWRRLRRSVPVLCEPICSVLNSARRPIRAFVLDWLRDRSMRSCHITLGTQ